MLRLDFVGRARVGGLKFCECEMSVRDPIAPEYLKWCEYEDFEMVVTGELSFFRHRAYLQL